MKRDSIHPLKDSLSDCITKQNQPSYFITSKKHIFSHFSIRDIEIWFTIAPSQREVCANLCKLAAHVQTWSQLFRLHLLDAVPGMAGTTGGVSQSSPMIQSQNTKSLYMQSGTQTEQQSIHLIWEKEILIVEWRTTIKGFRGKRRRKVPKEMKLCQVLCQVQLKVREAAKSPGRDEIKFKATRGSSGTVHSLYRTIFRHLGTKFHYS